jgi:hypothetical protein
MPCRAPAILRQCCVLHENPRRSWKYPNCSSCSLRDWYASDNIRETPLGSRKKPNAGRSPTCRLWMADVNSHMLCHAHAALCRGLEKSLSERCVYGTGTAWHVNKTRSHCVNKIGKKQSKTLAARHGRGRHGNGMVCVN